MLRQAALSTEVSDPPCKGLRCELRSESLLCGGEPGEDPGGEEGASLSKCECGYPAEGRETGQARFSWRKTK